MSTDTLIHEAVRQHYAERITNNASCCGPDPGAPSGSGLYPEELLASLPEGESAISYGCGDPITLASLQPGQTVLDLGSGAGLDCFFAAQKVGAAGRVIGVDMTPEMIERARLSAGRLKIDNVEFRQGYLEQLPVDSDSVDVIISNCVINLAPDKSLVFAEAFRVLKPGGRLAVSDIVTDGPLPESLKKSLSAWAGCISGAAEAEAYSRLLLAAGFEGVTITPVFFERDSVEAAIRDSEDLIELRTLPHQELHEAIYSAKITAIKPG